MKLEHIAFALALPCMVILFYLHEAQMKLGLSTLEIRDQVFHCGEDGGAPEFIYYTKYPNSVRRIKCAKTDAS